MAFIFVIHFCPQLLFSVQLNLVKSIELLLETLHFFHHLFCFLINVSLDSLSIFLQLIKFVLQSIAKFIWGFVKFEVIPKVNRFDRYCQTIQECFPLSELLHNQDDLFCHIIRLQLLNIPNLCNSLVNVCMLCLDYAHNFAISRTFLINRLLKTSKKMFSKISL